jgi:trehalose 6-phosphate synthase
VASRHDEAGALILSHFTGAARELTSALLVNPFSVDEIAEAIHRALWMPRSERQERMRHMRRVVRDNNVYSWAAQLMLAAGEAAQAREAFFDCDRLALASGL